MPTEVIMPKVDMDMETGTVATWHIQEGEKINKGDALFDIETDKATMEVEAPSSGILQFISAQTGDVVGIGAVIGWIFAEGEEVTQPQQSATSTQEEAKPETSETIANGADNVSPAPAPSATPAAQNGKVRATPVARVIARQKNIDLTTITGTGPRGRITKADVEQASAQPPAHAALASGNLVASTERLDSLGVAYNTVPVDRMRATIAQRLTESKSSVPHFYLQANCNINKLLAFRKDLNAALEGKVEKKISINDLLIKAAALALIEVPEANASWAGDKIVRYKNANISVAVAIEGGLMTPVVREADVKSIQAISSQVVDLAGRAKTGKLAQKDTQGGSFSISNLGMFGVSSFSAIVNPPEGMILAVGAAERRFVEDDKGQPIAASMLNVTLSCDHRVVDGAVGAMWLKAFKNLVENPVLLAVSGSEA